jgi:hypothetical protein
MTKAEIDADNRAILAAAAKLNAASDLSGRPWTREQLEAERVRILGRDSGAVAREDADSARHLGNE